MLFSISHCITPSLIIFITINLLIYFLVGRDKRRTSRMTIKVIFEKVLRKRKAMERILKPRRNFHTKTRDFEALQKSLNEFQPGEYGCYSNTLVFFCLWLYTTLIFCRFYTIRNSCVFFISISEIMYINGLLLLVAISIDRCVAVLFPIWHRCSRPKHLSPAVCAFLWIISFLLGGIPNIVEYVLEYNANLYPHLLMTTMICIPLITTSTVILLVKIVLKPKQNKRGRLLVMILITLLCFLIFTVPLVIYLLIINVLDENYFSQFPLLDKCFELGACLNSSINQ
ncbi:hypothetical protein E2320_011735, partial [Naja naja]